MPGGYCSCSDLSVPITSIGSNGVSGVGSLGGAGAVRPAPDSGFAEMLGKLIDNVESTNQEANTAVSRMLNGTGDVHEAMIALHEAEESLEITVAVRNKMVQAYQDIMRMPL